MTYTLDPNISATVSVGNLDARESNRVAAWREKMRTNEIQDPPTEPTSVDSFAWPFLWPIAALLAFTIVGAFAMDWERFGKVAVGACAVAVAAYAWRRLR